MQWMGHNDDVLWNGSEEVGSVVGVSVRKMKAQIVKMETVTLFDTLCIKCMQKIVKYFS